MFKLVTNISTEIRKLGQIDKENLKKVTTVLSYFGEQTVNEARKCGDYRDRTGNLRHSISYIVRDRVNKQLKFDFPERSEPRRAVDEAVNSVNQRDIDLVCVAGMQYAAHVEARGYTVLTEYVPGKTEIEKMIKQVVKR
jgi:hypothetical protein